MYMSTGRHTTLEGIARELIVGLVALYVHRMQQHHVIMYIVHIIIDGFPKKLYRKEAAEQQST